MAKQNIKKESPKNTKGLQILEGAFLPNGYEIPDKSKQFMKIEVGGNRIRLLAPPIMGYVFFNADNKPVRRPFHDGEFTPAEMEALDAKRDEEGKLEGCRHFWALLVWSYRHKAPKILEVTQSTIMKPLLKFIKDEDWGDPRGYDIDISRVGTGKNDTVFTAVPKPHKAIGEDIVEVLASIQEKALLNMYALLDGEYPFSSYEWD